MTPARRVLTEKRTLIWPIAIALIANVIVYAIVVHPLSLKVAGGEQQAQASASALTAARRDYAAARATVAGKAQADSELQKFYTDVLPPDISGARRITFLRIEQLAAQSNLRLERQTSDPKPQRDSDLVKFTYSATLSGEYRNIRRFIHELETAPEFLVLENVQVSQNEAEERRGALNVLVQVATYYRIGAHAGD
jgi:Tfp pilus assembly protein PilO